MLSVPDDVLFEKVDGRAVLLHLPTSAYFTLNPSGTRMFEVLARTGQVGDTCAELQAEFDVDPATLRRDLDQLVSDLKERSLLTELDRS